jgi:hypothetical protein
MTIIGQTEKKATKRVGILRRVDRISHKPQPNFQLWRSIAKQRCICGTLSNNKLASRENWFVWEGFRTGITAGYRFNTRLGVEMGVNYYSSSDKWHKQHRLISYDPATSRSNVCKFYCKGQIIAFDLAPALVLF